MKIIAFCLNSSQNSSQKPKKRKSIQEAVSPFTEGWNGITISNEAEKLRSQQAAKRGRNSGKTPVKAKKL